MGLRPSKTVQDAFAWLKKNWPKKNATDAAKKFQLHLTTLYRHKPYIEWRKSQKGNKP